MSLEHCSGATPVNAKAAAHVKVRNSTKFREKKMKNVARLVYQYKFPIHLIQLDNNHHLTKLAKQKAE